MPQTFALFILSLPGGRFFLLSPSGAWSAAAGLFAFQAYDPATEQDVQAQAEATAGLLNQLLTYRHATERSSRPPPPDPLAPFGRQISRLYPPVITQALAELPPRSSLAILANDPDLPWELAHDGLQYLVLQHVTARQLLISDSPRYDGTQRTMPWSALLIGNPSSNLPHVEDEIEDLTHLIQGLSGSRPPRVLMRQRATRAAVLQDLSSGGYGLVHFSGHVRLDSGQPEASGLLLANDELLTAADIRRSLGGQPVVFLNGCRSARGGDASSPPALDPLGSPAAGLAAAFIQGGALSLIGSLWPVHDTSSRDFALAFYRLALRGEPVGDALRQARVTAHKATPWDPLWAAYTLYGDPALHLAAGHRIERRPATVLAVHIRGLDALFAAGHSEERTGKLVELVALLDAQVARYGGEVSGLAHDLLIGIFGLPALRENDAERAVRAAQDMLASAGRLPPAVEIGVGISSGEAFTGSGSSGEPFRLAAMGPAVNQAAELARQAEPGTILVTEPVRRLAGSILETVPAVNADHPESGHPSVYRLLGLQPDTTATQTANQPALVGRDRELAALQEAWASCRQGRGQLASLVGEAGIGKSRLLAEFRRVVSHGDARWLGVACPTAYRPAPYELIAQLLRVALVLGAEAEGGSLTDRLRVALHQLLPAEAGGEAGRTHLALLGELLLTPSPDLGSAGAEPKVRQRQLTTLLGKLLASLAAQGPLVIACDDLYAADSASLDTLAQLAPGLDRLPVLLVVSYRAEADWQPPWWRRRNHTTLRLDTLDEAESRAFLASLLPAAQLSNDVARTVLPQAGGNPLFIRELVAALLESGALQEQAGDWRLGSPINPGGTPETIQRVILARIARLPDTARHLLNVAAVAGDDLDPAVLQAALAETGDATTMEDGLTQLEEREFLHRRWPAGHYGFTHALVRSVAYDDLSTEMQRRFHGRIGRALAAAHAGREIEVLELLAQHFDRSDERVKAVYYGLWAARRAAEAWANTVALDWYDRVQARIGDLTEVHPPDEAEQEAGATPAQVDRWRVEVLVGRAGALAVTGRIAEALSGYREALALIAVNEAFSVAQRADLCCKIAIAHHDQGKFDEAEAWLDQGLTLIGDARTHEAGRLHVWRGMVGFRRGRLPEALAACDRGIALLEQTDSPRDLAQAYNLQGVIQRNLGDSRQAIAAHERSVELYRKAGDIAGVERACSNLGCVYQDLSRWPDALRCFEQSAELCERTGEPRRQAAAAINLGEIFRRQGRLDQAVAAYERARRAGEEFGFPEATGMALMNLGACYLKLGRLPEAGACLKDSDTIFRELGTGVYLPELLRYRAEWHVAEGDAKQALAVSQEALAWAQTLNRRLETGQAQRAVGQAYRLLGRHAEAEAALNHSLAILEAQDSPHEVGLTLLELARLCEARAAESDDIVDQLLQQAQAYCMRAREIFARLGARLDLEQTQAFCKKVDTSGNQKSVG